MKRMGTAQKDPPVVYLMTMKVKTTSGSRKDCWGYYPRASSVPLNVSVIAPEVLGKTPAMMEMDVASGIGNWDKNFATEPAHGDVRMGLFFDWAVKAQNLADWGTGEHDL